MNYVCKMDLQSLHKDFITSVQNIYEPGEAENIWKLAAEHVLGSKTDLDHYTTIKPDEAQAKRFKNIQARLLQHEPIQYIINECWFYDIPFYVDSNVLIPRPETEELVDWIIRENKTHPQLTILDVGTGSGCIPVILKRKLPQAIVYSCDVSSKALHVARKNAIAHNTDINFLHADFLNEQSRQSLPEADIIVSNPPYIPVADKNAMRKNVLDHEPHIALFVEDNNPLIFYDAIAKSGSYKLKPGGKIYVEIHEGLATGVINLFTEKGYNTELKKDMQGKDRMVKALRI